MPYDRYRDDLPAIPAGHSHGPVLGKGMQCQWLFRQQQRRGYFLAEL